MNKTAKPPKVITKIGGKLIRMRRLLSVFVLICGTAFGFSPQSVLAADITVYKSPYCGCCGKWVEHMEANGHSVSVKNVKDLDPVKKAAGVPEMFQSCHTAMVEGYVIEGHVPAADVARLLREKPRARGLAVPGMPAGSPGMESPNPDRYDVVLFNADGSRRVYSKH